MEQKIWKEHVWKRRTVSDLKESYKKGEHTIRRILDRTKEKRGHTLLSCETVAIFDGTHIGDEILLAGRSPSLKTNLGWAWIPSETKEYYAGMRRHIESRGVTIIAVVLDGRTGIPRVFEDIPVQICQFHQLQIIKRKLTLRPKTDAGKDLLSIGFSLAHTDEATLVKKLDGWYGRHEGFVNERTYTTGTRRWRYTHSRVRSAYLSLKRNLSFLFTYQKFPELHIPNTTNSLDGYWSRVKNLLSAHRGKSKERIQKMVNEILRK